MLKILITAAFVFLVALPAIGQTATPTSTPTPTLTPNPPPNPTEVFGNLAWHINCPSPPCSEAVGTVGLSRKVVGAGRKTVAVDVVGTGTVTVDCQSVNAIDSPVLVLDTMTDADDMFEFTQYCYKVGLSITACTDCSITGWIRQDFN